MPVLPFLWEAAQRPLFDLNLVQDSVAMLFSRSAPLFLCFAWALGLPSQLGLSGRETAASSSSSQNIVTYDPNSVFINGKRVLLYNSEFHAYRLPVSSLWLDIFQKLKSAGISAVSFYTDWALLEGKPGNFTAEGVFALEPFFDAAKQAGIYLVARPGPYINAESSGGGFPGWLQRSTAISRTPDYLPSTDNYVKNVGAKIAKAQITNGGPVILVQPENEYTNGNGRVEFPNKQYFADVEKQLRDAGITVPLVSNDASPKGYFAPGTGLGAVDIYGHDSYPLGFDCSNPTHWPAGNLPTYFFSTHEKQSPSTPYTISEFQGGSFDPWGGVGFAKCTALTGPEFQRVFYKNNYGAKVAIHNLYMGYGGTNWGNLGHPGGYTSYDYGAAIAEDRTVSREKYSELKLQTNFLHASPAYLTAKGASAVTGAYVNTQDLATTLVASNTTKFYVVRHNDYSSTSATQYKLSVSTSKGNYTVPQLNNTSLTLNGRDSKIHVTDYDLGGQNLIYSTAEIFTWQKYSDKTVLVVYGGPGETHELSFQNQKHHVTIEGRGLDAVYRDGNLIINWSVSPTRRVALISDNIYVYFLDRNSAYNYWTLQAASGGKTPYTGVDSTPVIVNGGYLLRNASISGNTLSLNGDINQTTTFEVIGGAPQNAALVFNGQKLQSKQYRGVLTGTQAFAAPKFSLPNLSTAKWRYIDSLPEIQPNYDDSAWVNADHKTTNNTVAPLKTPTSLYASDYGFNTGVLLFRGHFTATGNETTLSLQTQGGTAFGSSIYLNGTLLSPYAGNANNAAYNFTGKLPMKLTAGKKYVITVVSDNMGLDENYSVGSDGNKNPRGILSYSFATPITWKLTGNLGGEDYLDRVRGPLNEGGLWAERQGYHLPNPPTTGAGWSDASPVANGVSKPGVGFFTTQFSLDLPAGYDIPLSLVLNKGQLPSNQYYRAMLFVNGYQFGKYVNNIGPQTSFPVPQGILNYNGANTVAVALWGFDAAGNKLQDLALVSTAQVQSGYGAIVNSPMPAWSKRAGAY